MKAMLAIPFFVLVCSGQACLAEDLMNAPFTSRSATPPPTVYQTSTVKTVLTGLIRFYSSVISPVDGPRSPSYPTGSAYGRQAIATYGFFPGVFLIADRLLHEADVNLGPTLTIYGKERYYDPLAHNTYWWDDSVLATE